MLHVLLHTSFSGCLSLAISASDTERNCLESAISWGYSCLFLMETQTSDPPNTSKQQSSPLLRDPLSSLSAEGSLHLSHIEHHPARPQPTASWIHTAQQNAIGNCQNKFTCHFNMLAESYAQPHNPDFWQGKGWSEGPAHLSWGQTRHGLHPNTSGNIPILPRTSRLGQM